MRAISSGWIIWQIGLCVALLAGEVQAHGQVMSGDDACVIRIGVFEAHFKLVQPQMRQQEQFCEDLPETGETVLVMEYLSPALRETPLELRVIRDIRNRKQYARLEDLDDIADIEAVTVFHQPPQVDPDVFTAVFTLDQPGWYIGIVTAKHPTQDSYYTAVFPIEVGYTGPGFWLPLLGLLGAIQLGYWWMNGQLGRWRSRFRARRLGLPDSNTEAMSRRTGPGRNSVVLFLTGLLLCLPILASADDRAEDEAACVSKLGTYRVLYQSDVDPAPINRMHGGILHLTTADGMPVSGAEITVKGGMPQHNHGLPTQPVVTEDPDGGENPGDYRVEGLRFHMSGEWQLSVSIRSAFGSDTCVIDLDL